jgi:chromatin remodeling complex protein RSC6
MPSKSAEKPKKAAAKAPEKPAKAAAKPAAKAAKPAAKKTNALQQPLTPSAELAALVGAGPIPRAAVVSKVWEYIKKHNLQDAADKRQIVADPVLKKIFGKDKVSMFEMNKHLAAHLK